MSEYHLSVELNRPNYDNEVGASISLGSKAWNQFLMEIPCNIVWKKTESRLSCFHVFYILLHGSCWMQDLPLVCMWWLQTSEVRPENEPHIAHLREQFFWPLDWPNTNMRRNALQRMEKGHQPSTSLQLGQWNPNSSPRWKVHPCKGEHSQEEGQSPGVPAPRQFLKFTQWFTNMKWTTHLGRVDQR